MSDLAALAFVRSEAEAPMPTAAVSVGPPKVEPGTRSAGTFHHILPHQVHHDMAEDASERAYWSEVEDV